MNSVRAKRLRTALLLMAAVAVSAILLLAFGAPMKWLQAGSRAALRPAGEPQLVGYRALPEEGPECAWVPASTSKSFSEILAEDEARARPTPPRPTPAQVEAVLHRKPVREIRDHYSAYSSIAVDVKHNEVVMTDESLFHILTYNRTENTPPKAAMSEPKRIIGGLNTDIEFQCGVYADPVNGDVYAVNNDTVDKLVIFSRNQRGNVAPHRYIVTPHTTYGIAVDELHKELFLTVQEAAAVSVFRKNASGNAPPIRLIQGNKTGLADPHGIAVDPRKDLLFVSNFGDVSNHARSAIPKTGTIYKGLAVSGYSNKPNWPLSRAAAVAGSGRFEPASITVYRRDAQGNVAPLRVISGSKTQLDWPTALSLDTKHGILFVANDTGNSILAFDENASGNVAPVRVIKGPKSLIKSPTGVSYDPAHNEVWSSNFGDHTATVYRADASGNVAPLRVIRSAPLGTPTPNIGNAYAPAYDSKRDQILVPN